MVKSKENHVQSEPVPGPGPRPFPLWPWYLHPSAVWRFIKTLPLLLSTNLQLFMKPWQLDCESEPLTVTWPSWADFVFSIAAQKPS